MLTYLESLFSFTPDQIRSWFEYDPGNPLLFSTSLFLGFFLAFYLVYILTRKYAHLRTVYVVLFSLFFYYKAGGEYFILLLLSAIFNYTFPAMMNSCRKKLQRKSMLTVIVVVNLLLLAYFKYTNFFILNFNNLFHDNLALQNIVLPVGISFYTFQALNYSIDLYRRELEPAKNVLDFTFYLTFFPQLLAGPIIRAKNFLPQMYREITLSNKEAGFALFLIIMGLVKKSVISDYISLNFVDRIFDSPLSYTPFETLMAAYGYTLQIYCDFSGYSDMAIGLALLMGFKLPENFRTPYKSLSVTEFWRRWHISLSSWLRDYLYIPLGGNRKGNDRTNLNLFLTMLIGGLWHGAAWKYIIWGALHGGALVVERLFRQFVKLPEKNILVNFVCWAITFHFVAFCWIFFKASDFKVAISVLENISRLEYNPEAWLTVIQGYRNVFILIFIGFMLHFTPKRLCDMVEMCFINLPYIGKAIVIGLVFWLVYATASSETQPFIYFQF